MTNVVEIVKFKLEKGITEQDFLVSNEAMDSFLKEQVGMIYRSLCFSSENNEYIDIVYWQDMSAAKKGQDAFFESKLCQQFAKNINKESVSLDHVNVIAALANCAN